VTPFVIYWIREEAPGLLSFDRRTMFDPILLRLENLSIGTRLGAAQRPLVRDVDLQVRRGEALGVVGESGSGKTLTALSIARMLPASVALLSGKILFEGTSIYQLPEAVLHAMRGKEISYVFQDPLSALNPTLSIGTQLVDVLKRHRRGNRRSLRERAIEALANVGIQHPEARMRAYPHELSGGMRQRVLIAMAMLCGPKLLIADEPTTALDVTVQARIIDLFRGIRKAGVSLIFISHNLDLVLEFCDRIAVMYGGRVLEVGTAPEIARSARHPYTRALLNCIPRLGTRVGRLRSIECQPPNELADLPPCPFAPRCSRAGRDCWSRWPAWSDVSADHGYACWNPIAPEGVH
jgi:oligopeptide/dipeptide ABC transporter ATP-binding protein